MKLLNEEELENLVLDHIRSWVKEIDQDESEELFRDKMDQFTNSFRNKWFDMTWRGGDNCFGKSVLNEVLQDK
jgi:hypothetical protein